LPWRLASEGIKRLPPPADSGIAWRDSGCYPISIMKIPTLIMLLALPVLHAQEAAPADLAARLQSVMDLKSHIAAREERLSEIASDIRSLDDRNEKRIDSIVETLKNLKDSEESKTRINAMKGDAIAGLRKSISIYQTKRREIFERLRTDKSAPIESLTRDMEKFDSRVQKRVDQILELAKSMPPREDVEKYESDGGAYWDGWYYETTRISDDWKQNRRQGVATEKTVRELRDALEKGIADLESKRSALTALLKERKLSDAERTLQEQELGRTAAILEHRKQELVELTATGTAGGDVAATSEAAAEVKDLLEDSKKDIVTDFWTILRKYGEAVKESDKIHALKANLEAREKWLAEHAGSKQ
jgi:hypothetical protein